MFRVYLVSDTVRLSSKVDECKPLPDGALLRANQTRVVPAFRAHGVPARGQRQHIHGAVAPVVQAEPVHADVAGRGLHSSTFRLNLGAFSGIGGACRGCLGDFGRCWGV